MAHEKLWEIRAALENFEKAKSLDSEQKFSSEIDEDIQRCKKKLQFEDEMNEPSSQSHSRPQPQTPQFSANPNPPQFNSPSPNYPSNYSSPNYPPNYPPSNSFSYPPNHPPSNPPPPRYQYPPNFQQDHRNDDFRQINPQYMRRHRNSDGCATQ